MNNNNKSKIQLAKEDWAPNEETKSSLLKIWRDSLNSCHEQAVLDYNECCELFEMKNTTKNTNSNNASSQQHHHHWKKMKEIKEHNNETTFLFRNCNFTYYKWLGISEFDLEGEYSVSDILEYITKDNDNLEQRRRWDPDIEELSIVSLLNSKNWRVSFQVYNTNMRFVSNREFVIQHDIYEESENVVWLIASSLSDFPEFTDSQAPLRSGNVRGICHSVSWRIEKIIPTSNANTNTNANDNNGNRSIKNFEESSSSKTKFRISFNTHSEPGGMVNATIYNLVSEKQALNTHRIVKSLLSP